MNAALVHYMQTSAAVTNSMSLPELDALHARAVQHMGACTDFRPKTVAAFDLAISAGACCGDLALMFWLMVNMRCMAFNIIRTRAWDA